MRYKLKPTNNTREMKLLEVLTLSTLLTSTLLSVSFALEHSCEVEDPPECLAESCLDCDNTPATCNVNDTAGTISCSANTSHCSMQPCDQCRICVGSFRLTGDGEWLAFSSCFNFPDSTDCATGAVLEECTQSFIPPVPNVYSCRCFGENCTAHLLETPIPTQASPSSSTTDVVMTTAAMTTNGTDPTVPLLKASVPTYLIIILTIVALIVVIVTAIIIAALYKCRGKFKITRRRSGTGQPGIGNRIFDSNTDWQLYERIGHGRYGMVYRGNYQNEIVAIKITSNRSSWENERNLYAMESTSHQNVLRYIATESRGSGYQSELFMITEYYPLGSLCVYLRNHRVSWEQACCMVRSLAKGLAHLHSEWYTNSAGILAEKYAVAHRDVKSANVLVRSDSGECVLSDLGFALILDRSFDTKQLANAGQVGTYRYMAPEALDARINLQDLESFKYIDIYAFALVAWEIITQCHVTADEDLPPYQLAFELEVGTRPTLDMMKEVVVTQRLRPALPTIWCADEHLSTVVTAVTECWDVDPEARPSAANIVHRMDDLCNTHFKLIASGNQTNEGTAHHPHSPTEHMLEEEEVQHSQSTPPPFYSPPLLPSATGLKTRPRYMQSSLPYLSTTGTPSTSLDPSTEPLFPETIATRDVALATTIAPLATTDAASLNAGSRPSVSVRNSLILGHRGDCLALDNSLVAVEMLDLNEAPPPFDNESCDSLGRSCDPIGDGYQVNRGSIFSDRIESDSMFSNDSEIRTQSENESHFNSDSGVPHSTSALSHSSENRSSGSMNSIELQASFSLFDQSKLTTATPVGRHDNVLLENSEGSVSTVTNENTNQTEV